MYEEMFIGAKEIKREPGGEDAANQICSHEFFSGSVGSDYKSDDVMDTKRDKVNMIYEKALFKCHNCEYQSEFYSSFVVHTDACNESLSSMSDVKEFTSLDLMDDVKDHKSFCLENGSFNQEFDSCTIKDEIVIEDIKLEKVYYNCSNCDFGSEYYCTYQEHISVCSKSQDTINNPMNVFECDICKESFNARYELTVHYRLHRQPKSEKKLKSKTHDKKYNKHRMCIHMQKQFGCTICSETFRYASYLACHMIKHSMEKVFGCRACQKKFKSEANLRWHIGTRHGNYLFDKCYEKFSLKKNPVYHIKSYPTRLCHICKNSFKCTMVRQSGPFACHLCQKSSLKSGIISEQTDTRETSEHLSMLKRHSKVNIRTIHDKTQYECEICHKTFTRKWSLKIHIETVHNKIKLSCKICPETFYWRQGLRNHMRVEHENLTYGCDSCHKTFSWKANLTVHIASVHKKMRHECEVCHKTYSNKSYLKEHKASVHNKIVHECEVCHRTFARKGSLKTHIAFVHNNIVHECEVCHRIFTRKSNLNYHKTCTHNNIRHECEVCQRTFSRRSSLKIHMAKCT